MNINIDCGYAVGEKDITGLELSSKNKRFDKYLNPFFSKI